MTSAQDLMIQGNKQLDSGDDQAEAAGKALRDRSQLASFWEEQAWNLASENKYQEALQSFEKALEYKSDYAWGIYGKACCYASLNQVDLALENLQQAFEIEPAVEEDANKDQEWESIRSDSRFQAIFNPESGEAKMTPTPEIKELLDQGLELLNSGEYEAAISFYDQALEIAPNSVIALTEKAAVLNGLERYQEALEMIEKVTKIQPDRYQAWVTKGRILENGFERYEEAISCYNKVLEFNIDQQDRALLWSFKSEALYPLERYQESIEAVDQALELDLQSDILVNAIYLKASCYALLQQDELALESLQKAIEIDEMCKDWAKEDSDWTRLHSNPKFQAITGLKLASESVPKFTITIERISCLKRSEWKGRKDKIYLKEMGGSRIWPQNGKPFPINPNSPDALPNYQKTYEFGGSMQSITIELWEWDAPPGRDDLLGSITINQNSSGRNTAELRGDHGHYQMTYNVDKS